MTYNRKKYIQIPKNTCKQKKKLSNKLYHS